MEAIFVFFFYITIALIWLLGILRALYFYLRWLRSQQWYWQCLLIGFANLGPLLVLGAANYLSRPMSLLWTIIIIPAEIGGLCMLTYLSVVGIVQGILLCSLAYKRWGRLNLWYRFLTAGGIIDLVVLASQEVSRWF